MDKEEFFREATLKICGNLDIVKSLHSLLLFLMNHMPVAKLYLQYYEDSLQSIRTIAIADKEGGKRVDLLAHLSKESADINRNVPADRDAFLILDPQKFPVSREMMSYHEEKGSSIIVLVLRTKSEVVGILILQTFGEPKFNESNLELVNLIKEPMIIAMSNALKHQEVLNLKEMMSDDNKFLQHELRKIMGEELVGINFGLKEVIIKARQVARSDSPVLLLGETGVGKDMIANMIHHSSPRHEGPFISVNCGAIPDSLIDSELFGHEKGAFTGALEEKRGRFERADKGTIFLDEIGELPLPAQVRLLNVLQNKEIERIGGTRTIPLNIRVIAATNRNLEEMVAGKEFREDLWFRLNVFPIIIPPLRERKADIPALVDYFILKKSKELKIPHIPSLAVNVIDQLVKYNWPGNVRELQNAVERELILNPSGPLIFNYLQPGQEPVNNFENTDRNLDEINRLHILKVLQFTGGVIHGSDGAAAILGINANTLRNRMNKLGINYKKSNGK